MTTMVIYQRMCASRRLLNFNILQSFSIANIRNLNTIKKEPILKIKSFSMVKRSFYRWIRKPTKQEFKIKDDVPDQYKLIYRSTMDRYILYAQVFTGISALIVVIACIIKYDFYNEPVDYSNWNVQPRHTENEVIIYLTAFFALVVILQVMVYQIPVRIYHLPKQKKYIFIFHGNYPFTMRKLYCKIGDVAHTPESGILPWKEAKYVINEQQKIILMEQYFRRPADLYVLLGVQSDNEEEDEIK